MYPPEALSSRNRWLHRNAAITHVIHPEGKTAARSELDFSLRTVLQIFATRDNWRPYLHEIIYVDNNKSTEKKETCFSRNI